MNFFHADKFTKLLIGQTTLLNQKHPFFDGKEYQLKAQIASLSPYGPKAASYFPHQPLVRTGLAIACLNLCAKAPISP